MLRFVVHIRLKRVMVVLVVLTVRLVRFENSTLWVCRCLPLRLLVSANAKLGALPLLTNVSAIREVKLASLGLYTDLTIRTVCRVPLMELSDAPSVTLRNLPMLRRSRLICRTVSLVSPRVFSMRVAVGSNRWLVSLGLLRDLAGENWSLVKLKLVSTGPRLFLLLMLTMVLNTWQALLGPLSLVALSCPRKVLWAKAMAITPCMAGPWCSMSTGLLLTLVVLLVLLALMFLLLTLFRLLFVLALLGTLNVTLLTLTFPTRLLNRELTDVVLLVLVDLVVVRLAVLVDGLALPFVFLVALCLLLDVARLNALLRATGWAGLLRKLLLPGLVPEFICFKLLSCRRLKVSRVLSTTVLTVELRLVTVLLRLTELTRNDIRCMDLSALKSSVVTTRLICRPQVVSTDVCLVSSSVCYAC